MEVTNLLKRDNGTVSFEICYEGPEWKKRLMEVSNAMQKRKPVQGYRAGKAPLGVAYRTYGKTLIDTAVKPAIDDAVKQVCEENDFAPVTTPNITIVEVNMGVLQAICSFVNYPEVEDFNYIGIPVDVPVKYCTEKDIDDAIDEYMRKHLYVHEVDREAEMGDIIEVDFTGTHNGGHFPYDHSSKSRFTMGSERLFAGLDQELVGHVAGDRLELSLTMPDDFHREDVRNMTLDLIVNVHGVWARDLVECTDEYVKEKVKDCDSLAEFREKQRNQIQKRYDNESRRHFERHVTEAIAGCVTCNLPESMVDVAMQRIMRTLAQTAASDGKTVEQALADEGRTVDDFKAMSRPVAEEEVKVSLALDYIVRHESFQISQQELDSLIKSYMDSNKMSYDEVVKRMGGIEQVAEKILNDKAFKLFHDNVKVNQIVVDEFPPLISDGQ